MIINCRKNATKMQIIKCRIQFLAARARLFLSRKGTIISTEWTYGLEVFIRLFAGSDRGIDYLIIRTKEDLAEHLAF